MKETLEQFERFMLEEGKSKNTVKNYLADARKFLEGVDRGEPGQIFSEKAYTECANKIKKSGLKPSSINRKLMSLRLFYRFLFETNVIEPFELDATKAVRAVKVQLTTNDTRWLEAYQVKELFAAIDRLYTGNIRLKVRAIFCILVNCGLRISEVHALKRENIDFERGLMHVYGKGGKYRIVPFNSAVARSLRAWYECEPAKGEYVFHSNRSDRMSVRGIQHFGEAIGNEVNFDFNIHGLRHTALKSLAKKTGSIEVVASVAGHSNLNTTRRYIQPSLDEIKKAMESSEFDF